MKTLAHEVEAVDKADPEVWLEFYGCFADEAAALNFGLRVTDAQAPMKKYRGQKSLCTRAGDEWSMSFPEWMGMWNACGKWSERGATNGKYCMRRIDRAKPYCVANMQIVLCRASVINKRSRRQSFEEKYGVCAGDFDSIEQMNFAKARFLEQYHRARQRGIEWHFSFSDWWSVWRESGLWDSRGKANASSAVMGRRGDIGPYSKENVYIITIADNFIEGWKTAPNRKHGGRLKKKSKETEHRI
ncbi:MAG TPA: hypothetical protein VN081_06770 [Dongiaceae bacterium]|nr:hypothetical protein [Dongiaceae bacterium]